MFFISTFLLSIPIVAGPLPSYPWLENAKKAYDPQQAIANRIATPTGYVRVETEEGSFQEWLRHLPLKQEGAAVYYFDKFKKANQADHVAVIDIDVGDRDLQQCADAVMRLRAEYLYAQQKTDCIHFNCNSGQSLVYARWSQGERPSLSGKNLIWKPKGEADSSYSSFRKFMDSVFQYAGTLSLSQEMIGVKNYKDMRIGDVLIEGGAPGHAVIVLDMAEHPDTKKKLFLIAQSYMPAQDVHVLVNYINPDLSPWYELEFKDLETPVWIFDNKDVKRFREE